MNRLVATMKNDVTVQVRNKLYAIGVGVGGLVAIALGLLIRPDQLPQAVPTLMILVVGGSTLFYVAAMILFEKAEGTLHATVVSPLRTGEYLGSKIITLSLLATLEAVVMIGGAMLILRRTAALPDTNLGLLLLGIVAMALLYTLVGIVVVVRYEAITDFLLPAAFAAVVLQLPFLHFFGLVEHSVFLFIPTSAPATLIAAAYGPLTPGMWVYAIGYTLLLLGGLAVWAYRRFQTHVITNLG